MKVTSNDLNILREWQLEVLAPDAEHPETWDWENCTNPLLFVVDHLTSQLMDTDLPGSDEDLRGTAAFLTKNAFEEMGWDY